MLQKADLKPNALILFPVFWQADLLPNALTLVPVLQYADWKPCVVKSTPPTLQYPAW